MNRSLIFVASLLFATVYAQFRYNREVFTRSCIPGEPSQVLFASFNPCYDTPGCELPFCCGAVADQFINFSLKYVAKENVTGGVNTGFLTGLTLSTPDNDPLKLPVPLLLPSLLLETALKFYPDMCYNGINGEFRRDFCPQTKGNEYTFKSTLQVSPFINTATVIIEFMGYVHEGDKEILCFRFWGRILAPNVLWIIPPLPLNLHNLLG